MSWTVKFWGRKDRPAAETFATAYQPAPGATSPLTGARLPRFSGTARDGDQGRRKGGALDQLRAKLQRAFTPSQPVHDVRMFAGRRELLLSLIRAIEEQQLHAVLFGDRGIGKTSLLHVLAQLAREARYIVRYTSCSETSTFDATFRAVAADIPLLYHADFDPTSEAGEQGAMLERLLPDTPLTVMGVSEIFAKLSGTRVLIILDEFDRATSEEFKRSVAELIKSLSDRSIRVQIVIAGVAADLTQLVEYIPSIRRNVLGLPVTMMGEAEVAELIGLGEAVSGLAFEPGAVDRIVDVSLGSPYLASLLAQQAAFSALDRTATQVAAADVVKAIGSTIRDVRLRIPPTARQQLAALEARVSAAQLAPLASEALRNFGVVLPQAAGQGGAAAVIQAAHDTGVLRTVTVGEQAREQFADESVALYLWLASQDPVAVAKDAAAA